LGLEDRQKLWDLLQYVMSDPKSDIVPAKKKLIEINLSKALPAMPTRFCKQIINTTPTLRPGFSAS
jgi:hypothetical protein